MNEGGFGAINDSTHSFTLGLPAITLMLAGGAGLVLLVRDGS